MKGRSFSQVNRSGWSEDEGGGSSGLEDKLRGLAFRGFYDSLRFVFQ